MQFFKLSDDVSHFCCNYIQISHFYTVIETCWPRWQYKLNQHVQQVKLKKEAFKLKTYYRIKCPKKL